MKYKQIWKTAAACLMAAVMLPGCSDEEGGGTTNPEDKYRTLVVSINSRSNAEPVGTRAAEDEEISQAGDEPYERTIDSWWLVILKQSEAGTGTYTVERVVSSEGGTATDPEPYDSTVDDSAERYDTSIEVELEVDQNYRFYALANLEGLAENGTEIIGYLNGLKQGDSFDLKKAVAVRSMSEYKDNVHIPMSSYGYDQYVDENTLELDKEIEMIRLIGKVSLKVKNLTKSPITVNKLSIEKFRTTGNIFLFPYDIESGTTNLLKDAYADFVVPKFPEEKTAEGSLYFVTSPDSPIEAGAEKEYPAQYANETDLTPGDFMITADIADRNDEPEEAPVSFIRRNDWLKIPIQIAPVETKIAFDQQHMPIGGLPTTITFEPNVPVVPIANCYVTEHGGKITVTYSLTITGDVFTDPILLYEHATEDVSQATVISNNDEGEPFLLNLSAGDNITLTSTGDLSGTFEVTTQELPNSTASAEIELSLVIVESGETIGPDSKTLKIPYTINISNKTTN